MNSHKDHAVRNSNGLLIDRVKTRKGDIRCPKCGGRFRKIRARAKNHKNNLD